MPEEMKGRSARRRLFLLGTIVCAAVLGAAIYAFAGFAPEDASDWSEVARGPFGGGDGATAANAFVISSAEQLAWLAKCVNDGESYSGAFFRLGSDIDLKKRLWRVSIGGRVDEKVFRRFKGHFDGGGYTLSNLRARDCLGLFGSIGSGGSVSNLHLINVDVRGRNVTGGLVGYNVGTVENCTVTGKIRGESGVGGLVAHNDGGLIVGSSTRVDVRGESGVGALVGYGILGAVRNSRANGSARGTTSVGGFMGTNQETCEVSDSIANVIVHGADDNVGGFVGANQEIVRNCEAHGRVEGKSGVGGFVGFNIGKAKISDCRAEGDVKGDQNVGGFAGANSGTLENCRSAGRASGTFGSGSFVGDNNEAYGVLTNCVGRDGKVEDFTGSQMK